MADESPFGEPLPEPGRVTLGLMALVLALASFLVPGGLIAVPALFLASRARRSEGPGTLVTAARVLSVASMVVWAVLIVVFGPRVI